MVGDDVERSPGARRARRLDHGKERGHSLFDVQEGHVRVNAGPIQLETVNGVVCQRQQALVCSMSVENAFLAGVERWNRNPVPAERDQSRNKKLHPPRAGNP